ncbi:hypothetical protein RUND412_007785 [Rhizina undulata]
MSFNELKVHVELPFQHFCRKNDILNRLEQILEPNNPAGTPVYTAEIGANSQTTLGRKIVILHGMGGIGKSQIALEYAHRFFHCYTSVFWINADDDSVTTESTCKIFDQLLSHFAAKSQSSPVFQKISITLGIRGKLDDSGRIKGNSAETAMKAVRTWLSSSENRGWLFLVHNFDKAKVRELEKLIPTCDWGSILVTTRLPKLHKFGECVEVEGIGAEAGLELLLKSSGKILRNLDNFAQEIVKALGELPLALDQAGAFISSLQRTFAAYRIKMKEGMKAIFNEELDEPSLSLYKASVLTTWELSFQELTDDARQLLQLCAFLNNDEISEGLFRSGKSAVPWIAEDESRLDSAIQNLFTFSLAKRKEPGDTFWIHPLVHAWARERNDSTIRKRNAEDALKLVASAIKSTEEDQAIFIYCGESDMSIMVAHASSVIASAYKNLGYYIQAEGLYQRIFAAFKKALGKDHNLTLRTMGSLIEILDRHGQHHQALEWKKKKLARRHDEALECYRRALVGYEKILGKDHRGTLDIVRDMAFVLKEQKQYEEVLEYYRRTLAWTERTLGKDHR